MTFPRRSRDSLAEGALLLVLVFSIFAFGAVHRWASAITEVGIWWLAAILLIARPSRFSRLGILVISSLLFFAYLGAQCLPLPAGLLESLTPSTARYYQRTVAAIPPAEGVSTLAAASVASTEWRPVAIDAFAARSELLRYLAYALALAIASGISRPRRFVQALVGVGCGVAIFALIQGATWNGYLLWFFAPYETGPRPFLARLTGPFVNPDHFALLLELVLPPAAALLAARVARILRRMRMRRTTADLLIPTSFLAIGIAVLIAALIGTASRGGIVGGMLGLLVAAAGASAGRTDRDRRVERTGRWAVASRWSNRLIPVGIAAAIVLGGFMYAGSKIRTELSSRFAQSVSNPDLGYRTELWRQSLGVLGDFPLVGVGLQGWKDVYPRYRRYPLLVLPIHHAHNDYIEWPTEVGVVGVALTIVLVIAHATWVWTNRALPRAMLAGFGGALVAIGWHEFFDFGLRVPANALLLATLLGLCGNRHWQTEEASDRVRQAGSRPWPLWKAISGFRLRRRRRHAVKPKAQVETERKPREIVVESPSTERPPLGMLSRSIVLAFATVLTLTSFRQFREFLAWNSARQGSFDPAFAAKDATTWTEAASRLGDTGDAARKAMYRQAIRLRPAYARAYREWAAIETDSSAKLRVLDAGIYADPVAVDLRLALADLLDRSGRPDEALIEIETAAYTVPVASEHSYLRKSNTRLNAAVTEAADRGFQRAIAERPKDSTLLHELALSYVARESWLEAARTWMKAGELDGDWASFGWAAGESFARAGSYADAEEPLRKVIAAAPDEGLPYWTLAVASLLPQAKYEEAEAVLERALRRPLRQVFGHQHQRVLLFESLFRVRWQANDRRRAIEALREAIRAEPRNPLLQFELGVAYLEMQSYDLGGMAFDRAIALDAKNAAYHFYKGVALQRATDLEGALAAYRRAMELEPSNLSYRAAFDQVTSLAARR